MENTFTIPGTKRVLKLPKMSTHTLTLDLMATNPKPKAPLQAVNIAGHETHERNFSHPDYKNALKSWYVEIDLMSYNEVLVRVAEINPLSNDERKQVAAFRSQRRGSPWLNGQSDELVWLKHIAIQSDNVLMDLYRTIRAGGEPTNVEETAENF